MRFVVRFAVIRSKITGNQTILVRVWSWGLTSAVPAYSVG